MSAYKYNPRKQFVIGHFKVGDDVIITPHTSGGSVPVTHEDKVAKITQTTLTTEGGKVFNISRGEYTRGQVGGQRGRDEWWSDKIWPAGDKDLQAWIEAMEERQRRETIELEAKRALGDVNYPGYSSLDAAKVERAIAAAQAWLDDTAADRAEAQRTRDDNIVGYTERERERYRVSDEDYEAAKARVAARAEVSA